MIPPPAPRALGARLASLVAALVALGLGISGCRCGCDDEGPGDGATETAAHPYAALLDEIQALEWQRRAIGRLAELGRHPDPTVRRRAVLAMARLRRADAIGALRYALVDVDPSVRAMATFGIGLLDELATPELESALLARYAAEAPDAGDDLRSGGTGAGKRATRVAVLDALGRIGTPAVSLALLEGALTEVDPGLRETAGLALGVYARRGHRADRDAVTRLIALTRDSSDDVRAGATYALMRLREPAAADAMAAALADVDPEIRAMAARALGDFLASGAPENETTLAALSAGTGDEDWRVRVEAMRALAKGAGPGAGAAYDEALATTWKNASASHWGLVGANFHALLAGLETGERFFAPATRGEWTPPAVARIYELSDVSDAVIEYQPKELLSISLANCAAAFNLDLKDGKPDRVRRCGSGDHPAWRRAASEARLLGTLAASKGHSGPGTVKDTLADLKKLAAHEDARVRTAAVSAIAELDLTTARIFLREVLADEDIAVLTTAADGIARAARNGAADALAPAALLSAYARLDSSTDSEAQVAILAALGALKPVATAIQDALLAATRDPNTAVREAAAKAYRAITGEAPGPLPGGTSGAPGVLSTDGGGPGATAPAATAPLADFPPVATGTMALVKTTKGAFKLELLAELAPLTVRNFVALARKKFYDGIVIHRVVPNFVVQAGCPRGDGWGGPGYTIVDEVHPMRFERGTVGMALAGKDTGGSQWFIMHSAAPHLDARYTIFAVVTEGMEIVDRLQVGDRIAGIDITPPG